MGVVQKQATRAAIFSYFGALLGFITVWYVNRTLLSAEQNGLVNLLVSIMIVTGSLSNLGFAGVITRMFPRFRDTSNGHNGFILYPITVSVIGFLVFLVIYFLFADDYAMRNQEKSALFSVHIYYLVPLTFFWAMFNVFDAYSRAVYHTTAGVFIKEILQRVMVLFAAVCYAYQWISFERFLLFYCMSFCSTAIILGVYLWMQGELKFMLNRKFITEPMWQEMMLVAFFSIITGLSSLLISTIDKLMVNDQLGLSAAGVFAIATYFGSIIHIPSRSIGRVSSSVIADAWAIGDMERIRSIYHKTCLNQLIIGAYLLLGIWINIDAVLSLMPAEYAQGKYVILFLGLGYLVDMATGSNGIIIATSKYYRYDTYFMLFLVLVTIGTNLTFIPIYGITGAAVASLITYVLFNTLRYVFLVSKFRLQPFDKRFLYVLLLSVFLLLITCIPDFSNPYWSIVFKGSLLTALFWAVILRWNVSPDLTSGFATVVRKYVGSRKI